MIRNKRCNCPGKVNRLAGYLDASGNYQDGTNPDPTYGGTVTAGDPLTATVPAAVTGTNILSSFSSSTGLNWEQIAFAVLGTYLLVDVIGQATGKRR
jgi:hypothetical protein